MLFLTMLLAMRPARVLRLYAGVRHVPLRRMGVVSRFFVTAGVVVFGCFIVMASGIAMMLGSGSMMFGCFF